ncbi:hypothetical protein [Burkholderia vietnamiensis]|uniref:hypothetical protein n=1 Tax=Burkholderia vietnamiensis TaxID=60552 RepID=UPI001CF35113|nr:hypothetical protein [Burkholderia vietnamiensis]MCA8197317.1 hypothetical protein [Burkholderia vietnamiensis]MCA8228228.1 hypothetical protein [Burkholderia vietnamiensis]
MSRIAEQTGLSADEVAVALAKLGEDPTVERIEEIQSIINTRDERFHGDRDLVVQDVVHRATQTVATRAALREAIDALTGVNAHRSYEDAGISFGRDGRFTTVNWRDGRRLACMQGRFSRDTLVQALRENMLPVGEGRPYPPRAERDGAELGGLHYSELILRELEQAHGWRRRDVARASVTKVFAGRSAVDGRPLEREFVARFDEPRNRYLAFEAGWLDVFDIDCRDRDTIGVAAEFDQRATQWAAREIAMPALPRYVHEAIGRLTNEGVHRTAGKLDEFLADGAEKAAATVDEETRLNAYHEAKKLYREYPVFIGLPTYAAAEVVRRGADGRVSEVAIDGRNFESHVLISRLESGLVDKQDRAVMAAVLHGFGIQPGRAFDLVNSPNFTDVDAARDLRDCLWIEPTPAARGDASSLDIV